MTEDKIDLSEAKEKNILAMAYWQEIKRNRKRIVFTTSRL